MQPTKMVPQYSTILRLSVISTPGREWLVNSRPDPDLGDDPGQVWVVQQRNPEDDADGGNGTGAEAIRTGNDDQGR
jgi:hypothetical protein